MIKITQASPEMLNSKFSRFARTTLYGQNKDATYLISQMKQYEKSYKKLGMLDVFSESAARLADGLNHRGLDDFAGIIYSNLVKLPNISPKQREIYAQRALEVAQKQGDLLHTLARIVDLKRVYKDNGRKRQVIDTLLLEEKQLIAIIKDFEKTKQSYRTYNRGVNTLEIYQQRLAMARVDIAKGLMHSNPEAAERKLQLAIPIFEHFGREKELNFAYTILGQLAQILKR
jgi:hypothetical protein